ncbi:MAG TPA: 30S ribosome-binding factor RbfA [Thermoanaerobaculia bacterium]|jgi:ribosome-binding factor A
MKKESRRSHRVADLVRSELSSLVLTVAHDPELRHVTITDVVMPSDLRSARVYYSRLGSPEDLARAGEALERAAGFLRGEVGRRCRLRYAPELHFTPDLSLARGARVEEILNEVLPHEESGEDGPE